MAHVNPHEVLIQTIHLNSNAMEADRKDWQSEKPGEQFQFIE